MTKIAILLCIVVGLSSFQSYAGNDQGGGETNEVDSLGRKQGLWIFKGKDFPEKGYPLDGKVEEGDYVDDRKEGLWTRYWNDGVTPKLRGTYVNNRPNGSYEKIYPDGTTREKGTFSRGKYLGTLERYHPNGQLEYSATMNEDGLEEGEVKYYYANGQEEFVYTASDGMPTGKAIRYWENGNIKEEITFGADGKKISSVEVEMVDAPVEVSDPGKSKEKAPKINQPRTKGASFKPNGYNKIYNENDEIWQDGDFRNGTLWNGKVYVYDEDGILLKVRVFKEGFYHSDGQL